MVVLGAVEAGGGCWEAELWTWVCKETGETPGAEASDRLDGGCWVFPGRVPAETKSKAVAQAALPAFYPSGQYVYGLCVTTPMICPANILPSSWATTGQQENDTGPRTTG